MGTTKAFKTLVSEHYDWYFLTLLMHIVAELRSIEFSGQLPESNNFLRVPVNYPSLNELVSMLEL
jgi:hypothetical protein